MAFQIPSKLPLWLAGQQVYSSSTISVFNKFDQTKICEVSSADETIMETAIASACESSLAMQNLKPYERRDILTECWTRIEQQHNDLAYAICIESGKPIKDARGEVARLVDTFRTAAEEAVRIDGEIPNLQISPRATNYHGFVRRFPVGPSAFISPFNFPLNLAAHKIAPAIAAGCPFILKPASYTPISAILLGQILSQAGLPKGAFSILPSDRSTGQTLVTDERIRLLSFTGSANIGWELKRICGKKKVVLELGGNAVCIVHDDANINDAVDRMTTGIFYQSGQSCISVQRVLVHTNIYDQFKMLLVQRAEELVIGDPLAESTQIGPLISEGDAKRLELWIQEACDAGGRILCGGKRHGCFLQPTILENVSADQKICGEEAFGPIAVLSPYRDFQDAIRVANYSRYGLQAGIFSRDVKRMMDAWEQLEVGGVIFNDVPSWRVDNMPYGGVKDSGLGREGVRSAIAEMTEPKLLVIRNDK